MNRIYQGRVTRVEILRPLNECNCKPAQHGNIPEHWVALPDGEKALWHHHERFQDAVNYYIVALAALGTSPEGKLTKLRCLLGAVWAGFDKKGQQREGLGDSLMRTWQLDAPPSLAEAVRRFQQPLFDHGVTQVEMELAGESLLQDLGGEGSIQQNGPEYWPYFCQSGFKRGVTFPRSADQLAKDDAQSKMAEWIWSAETDTAIKELVDGLKQSYFCNLVAGAAALTRERTVELFKEAIEALFAEKHIDGPEKGRLLSRINASTLEVAAYAGGSIKYVLKERFYGFLVFKHLSPDAKGLAVLRSIYPKPEPRQPKRTSSPNEKDNIEARLRSLSEDPIKLVRDKAQIVFPAFSALPIWANETPCEHLHERSAFRQEISEGMSGRIVWKLFDVAAFKEALKVYNQFQQNLEKREEKLDGLATKLLLMDGEQAIQTYDGETAIDQDLRSRLSRIWRETKGKPKAPKNEAGEEQVIASFKNDPRIDRLRRIINDDLAEEYRLTDGRRTPYGLRRRTMKGWSEVRRQWLKAVKPGTNFAEDKRGELKGMLDALRSGEKREQIGSHKLFEALIADAAAWGIWREPDVELQERINNGWTADPLEAFREYCETREALEELSAKSLNFTPADARYSRRLFLFTDACSFGNDSGDYKHDPTAMAVTVPVAAKDPNGRLAEQRFRIAYSAPRLLRDQIRGEDGTYAQDWVQPMMHALFGKSESAENPQELKDAAVQLMPDYDSKGQKRVLLNFPLTLTPAPCWEKIYELRGQKNLFSVRYGRKDKKLKTPLNGGLWESNIRTFWEGDSPKKRDVLCWLEAEQSTQEWSKGLWWRKTSQFRVLAADLGTRHAASIALLDCGKNGGGTARFIGRAGEFDWFARYRAGAILRLPGENAMVLRPETKLDADHRGKYFREELFGERGRSASLQECEETFAIVNALAQTNLLADVPSITELRECYSLPEQNDKLLVAMRRAQNWIAACVSWHWKLTAPEIESQRGAALDQLGEQDRIPEWQKLAALRDAGVCDLRRLLHEHIVNQRHVVEKLLLALTRRILPLRDRDWEWVVHPEKADCHLLRQTNTLPPQTKAKLRGQRGLSMARIEQLSELRRRWQSLNQALRREIGQRPPTAAEMRNDPIPDPCPDILRKLENIREQRVNQTAHLILAEALGLKLKTPELSAEQRAKTDTHGEYKSVRPPVDFIVLEDLSRYLSDQGRAKSENTRLMKWCHRAICLKVKMLAEPFGIPVLETSAAYTSRFCSLTGAAGFRAAEVGWTDRHDFRWRVLREEAELARQEGKPVPENAAFADALFADLEKISRSTRPHRTLLAPQPGGPIFISAKEIAHPNPGKTGYVLPMQADINAAVNIALRAITHPDCSEIHQRLRTERKKGSGNSPDSFASREPRRFSGRKVAILSRDNDLPREKNTNLFFDRHGIAPFGRARVESDDADAFPYASGPALWKTVNDRKNQWSRCDQLNRARLAKWQNAGDNIPM
jgi:hypothetical protein